MNKPNDRIAALHDRILEYYKAVSHVNNREAIELRQAFGKWAKAGGYTADEISQAKKER